jgi:hypothetical protein
MTLPDALEQLAKLAEFLDREIKGCGSMTKKGWVIAPMWGVEAMRDTRTALEIVVGYHEAVPVSEASGSAQSEAQDSNSHSSEASR